jgi:hypothetical protein
MLEPDEREQLIENALRIVRQRNFERYGVDDANEAYIRSCSDSYLTLIVGESAD